MRVGIVNDSPLAREALRRLVEVRGGHRVVWQAQDGLEAQVRVLQETPDVVLMDLFMPHCDGVEATRAIMRSRPCPILLVTASVDAHVDRVFQAMGAGALDAIDTPLMDDIPDDRPHPLLRKMEAVARFGRVMAGPGSERRAVAADTGLPPIVALGASSGGPGALARILATLPDDFPAALCLVQHVDAHFGPRLARWLDQQCVLPVRMVEDGAHPAAGTVHLAPGGTYLHLDERGRFRLREAPPEQLTPSVDRFFRSLVPHAARVRAAGVLTGMGRDGALGLLALRQAGVATFAQDRASATVYGMPKAALELGAAEVALPLEMIAEYLLARVAEPAPLLMEGRG